MNQRDRILVAVKGANGSSPANPVEPRVLRERVRVALRESILTARLPPGSHIGEADVASALSVSRTPVREAIRELAQEGLLVLRPHRGAEVAAITDEEIENSYRVKVVLDELAMERASTRLTSPDFATLEAILRDMERESRAGRFIEAIEADAAFHVQIADAADLGLLRRTWASVDDMSRMTSRQLYARHPTFPSYLAGLSDAHRRLIEVLKLRDPVRAASAAREHLDETHQRFLSDLADQKM